MKNWRVNIIFLGLFLFGAAIMGRLVFLQIIEHDHYKALAHGQQKDFQILKGDRGDIFFKEGELLSTNIRKKYVYASPLGIEEKEREESAKKLASILELKEEEILEKLKKESLFELIKKELNEEELEALEEINLPGIYLGEGRFREYPQGEIASKVTGFLGGSEKGQYGIEGYYDDILRGKEKYQETERSFMGNFLSGLMEDSCKGSDLFLTLDYSIQFKAENLLKEAKEELEIEGGQIIVLDPFTGEIVAFASYPNFDPNNYSDIEDFQIFQNGAIQKLFEPGSAFKPITMAAALNEGKITPQTSYIDTGSIEVGGGVIRNYKGRSYGQQTMTGVLEKSINTGAVFAGEKLGHELLLEYLEKFGFFEPTEIDLQGEISSKNEELKKGYDLNFATTSFGQGIEITPIQLVRAFSAIANGGNLVKPHMVLKLVEDGKVVRIEPEISSEKVISQKTASQLTAMMISVTENGFGKAARVPGYYVAGKTGTAQVPWTSLGVNKRGYSDKTWQSFIGFAPAFNPRFLVLVQLDNPKTRTAEYSAVPVFQRLAKYIIDYWHIPPDYE